jgi:hypothetical protein
MIYAFEVIILYHGVYLGFDFFEYFSCRFVRLCLL